MKGAGALSAPAIMKLTADAVPFVTANLMIAGAVDGLRVWRRRAAPRCAVRRGSRPDLQVPEGQPPREDVRGGPPEFYLT